MRRKNLCVHGEDAKRILAYSPNTLKDIKVCISQLIIIQIIIFFRFVLTIPYGMCAARAFCDCPAIISHRPRSQNILKKPALHVYGDYAKWRSQPLKCNYLHKY